MEEFLSGGEQQNTGALKKEMGRGTLFDEEERILKRGGGRKK